MLKRIIFGFLRLITNFIGYIVFTVILLMGMVIIFLFNEVRPFIVDNIKEARETIQASSKEDFLPNETTFIFTDEGRPIKKLTLDQDSEYLEYEKIPQDVIDAFVAIEDRNFWNHKGIDLKGITRVLLEYGQTDGEEKHGASTITQQVTRRAFLTTDKTMERKIKEIFYAFEMEKKYSKEEIMEFYVNDIYYANQCYGIAAASKFYFNKDVNDLTLSETAYLCAIPNIPSYYDPVKNPENAIPRKNKILNDMLECDLITKDEYRIAYNSNINLDYSANHIEISDYQTTYAIKCATEYFMKLDGFEFRYEYEDSEDFNEYNRLYNEAYEIAYKKLCSQGYRVYTSLNDDVQNFMQEALDKQMAWNTEINDKGVYELQAAATLIDNSTGKVIAIVGGRSQDKEELEEALEEEKVTENSEENNEETEVMKDDSETLYSLNRAYQSFRQPGSSIKPLIVYTPGMELMFTPKSTIFSISVTAVNKKGTDISKLTGPAYSYRDAVVTSNNGAADYVYYRVGPRNGLQYLQNMGFHKIVPEDYTMSSGLGGFTYGVSTEEMAGAYCALANGGIHRNPTCIVSIIDRNGNEIYVDEEEKQVYGKDASYAMCDIIKGVITRGTARRSVKWDKKIDIGGKTGTTNDYKDGWFAGNTPYYSLAVWAGYDSPRTVSGLQGGTYPTRIWSDVMNYIHEDLEEAHYEEYDIREMLKYSAKASEFLPDIDPDEELSPGYTVADYRVDRIIGSEAERLIPLIAKLNVITSESDISRGQNYYYAAANSINQISSSKYRGELWGRLNPVYHEYQAAVELYRILNPPPPPPEETY